MTTIGILLAGGASRRYGSPKAFAQFEGRAFYEIAYELLQAVCDEVMIVSRSELLERFPQHLQVIMDDEEVLGEGPLAGIYSAMKNRTAERYVVLPCDMPYLTPSILPKLMASEQATMVRAIREQNRTHPLVSVWKRATFEPLFTYLQEGNRRVQPFMEAVGCEWVAAELVVEQSTEELQNMNEPVAKQQEDFGGKKG